MGRRGGFDIVVVGAGAAGCVIARRVSESGDRTVLLLEAGPDLRGATPPNIAMAGACRRYRTGGSGPSPTQRARRRRCAVASCSEARPGSPASPCAARGPTSTPGLQTATRAGPSRTCCRPSVASRPTRNTATGHGTAITARSRSATTSTSSPRTSMPLPFGPSMPWATQASTMPAGHGPRCLPAARVAVVASHRSARLLGRPGRPRCRPGDGRATPRRDGDPGGCRRSRRRNVRKSFDPHALGHRTRESSSLRERRGPGRPSRRWRQPGRSSRCRSGLRLAWQRH